MLTLIATPLEKAAALLESEGELLWAKQLRDVCRDLKEEDSRAARDFLRMRGGMGSIDDLVLMPMKNGVLDQERYDIVNAELAQLLEDARNMALTILGPSLR
jgi:hypothetical protein